jgi:hypothetical protein
MCIMTYGLAGNAEVKLYTFLTTDVISDSVGVSAQLHAVVASPPEKSFRVGDRVGHTAGLDTVMGKRGPCSCWTYGHF